MKLTYILSVSYEHSSSFWGEKTKRVYSNVVERMDLISRLKERNTRHWGSCPTSYRDRWLRKRHILTLEANDETDLELMIHWLSVVAKINYTVIESSRNKYWIMTDYIGSWKQVRDLVRIIPGVSPSWYKRIVANKQIELRASPHFRTGELPNFHSAIPNRSLANPRVVEWIEEFWKHFHNQDMIDIAKDWERQYNGKDTAPWKS